MEFGAIATTYRRDAAKPAPPVTCTVKSNEPDCVGLPAKVHRPEEPATVKPGGTVPATTFAPVTETGTVPAFRPKACE